MRSTLAGVLVGLTVPHAIIIGSVVIGGAILLAPSIAPYRFTGEPSLLWRLDAVTGKGVLCKPAKVAEKRYTLNCD